MCFCVSEREERGAEREIISCWVNGHAYTILKCEEKENKNKKIKIRIKITYETYIAINVPKSSLTAHKNPNENFIYFCVFFATCFITRGHTIQ